MGEGVVALQELHLECSRLSPAAQTEAMHTNILKITKTTTVRCKQVAFIVCSVRGARGNLHVHSMSIVYMYVNLDHMYKMYYTQSCTRFYACTIYAHLVVLHALLR